MQIRRPVSRRCTRLWLQHRILALCLSLLILYVTIKLWLIGATLFPAHLTNRWARLLNRSGWKWNPRHNVLKMNEKKKKKKNVAATMLLFSFDNLPDYGYLTSGWPLHSMTSKLRRKINMYKNSHRCLGPCARIKICQNYLRNPSSFVLRVSCIYLMVFNEESIENENTRALFVYRYRVSFFGESEAGAYI